MAEPSKSNKRLLQGIAGPEIQVIGRFIQDQDIDAHGDQARQGCPAAFAARRAC